MEDSVVKSVDILLKDNKESKEKLHQNQTKNKRSKKGWKWYFLVCFRALTFILVDLFLWNYNIMILATKWSLGLKMEGLFPPVWKLEAQRGWNWYFHTFGYGTFIFCLILMQFFFSKIFLQSYNNDTFVYWLSGKSFRKTWKYSKIF
jgi:hypothetical protein